MSEEKKQRLRYTELSPEGVGAMRAVEHYLNAGSGLEPVLLELVRLRASLMNECGYCIGLHGSELRRHHEPESRIGAVAGWRETDAFTERERAALRWTEVVTNLEGHVPAEEFDAVRRHFGEKELVDLTMAIASINAWNLMAIAFRPQWRERSAPAEVKEQAAVPGARDDGERAVVDDDGGKVSTDEEAG